MNRTLWPILKTALTSILFFGFISITFSYAMFQGGFVSWFLFFATLPLALYVVLIICYPIRSLRVHREVTPKECSVGENIHVKITLERALPFPLFYLLLHDRLSPHISKKNLPVRTLLFPGFKRKIVYTYDIPAAKRGEYSFDGLTVSTGDPLGLVQKEHTFPIEENLIVFPKQEPSFYEQIGSNRQEGEALSSLFDLIDTTMAVGAREYVPGDKFSWVDWKSTARKRTLMTKEFEQRSGHTVYLMFDRSASDAVSDDVFERNLSFSVSMANAVVRKGASLHFFSLGEEIVNFHLDTNKNLDIGYQRLLYHMARTDRDGKRPFAQMVQEQLLRAEKDMTLVCVALSLETSFVQTLVKAKRQYDHIIVFVPRTDPEEVVQKKLQYQLMAHGIKTAQVHTKNIGNAWFEVKSK
ncbi:DUF58 domain-containing protein [Aureibacillus halotolerans]|uniref:Uncharacterized protein (DUF58 family) n=1 Tax=Aureibacillus halotolerans TaxID=1508390 RepID=A0A4R6TZP9_9BACI|nr:DUF58 domain-containing protein [Aureibacillus halotolerans]TDQ36274.1 uncharacterized protein (DUF58 family) [Aureibacillus halotolerans]